MQDSANRRDYCKTKGELALNEEICDRLKKISIKDRLLCYKIARNKFLTFEHAPS